MTGTLPRTKRPLPLYVELTLSPTGRPEVKHIPTEPKAGKTIVEPADKQRLEAAKPSSATTAKPLAKTEDTASVDTNAILAIELEKRKRRAERFGIPLTEAGKALERAQRFGVVPAVPEQADIARVKRFGDQRPTKNGNAKKSENTPVLKKITDDPAEAEKAKKRAERFGGGNDAKKAKA